LVIFEYFPAKQAVGVVVPAAQWEPAGHKPKLPPVSSIAGFSNSPFVVQKYPAAHVPETAESP
jgi:hypothetical protein